MKTNKTEAMIRDGIKDGVVTVVNNHVACINALTNALEASCIMLGGKQWRDNANEVFKKAMDSGWGQWSPEENSDDRLTFDLYCECAWAKLIGLASGQHRQGKENLHKKIIDHWVKQLEKDLKVRGKEMCNIIRDVVKDEMEKVWSTIGASNCYVERHENG